MFSGIIQCVGRVERFARKNEAAELVVGVEDSLSGFELGESIAVNGVCLTVRDSRDHTFTADLGTETLNRTNLGELTAGGKVNLERSLTPQQKISGHFVSGHVDRVGRVRDIQKKSGEILFRFEHPPDLRPYIIEKGSIAVDGISLTVFSCRDDRFSVSVIPFTFSHTNLNARKIGDAVNLECDIIGKYVYKACETLLSSRESSGPISLEFLRQKGFIE
ncbi:MAG: riboflavin synthase [Nitrospinae bacterium CG11_big_fil_rev_8_21_14_0_20_56_8]|nr:MAG: riboflavin synthase [Nitrospinae bacterium CG11_big_fil_rev_8_21_14_0_20_56_8]